MNREGQKGKSSRGHGFSPTYFKEAGLARAILAHVFCVPMADHYIATRRRSSALPR